MTLKRGKEHNMAETITTPQSQPIQAEVKYTDADVDAIINKKFASWQEKQDKAIADAVAKVEEANRLAQMNDKEKADHERKAMEEELSMLKAEKAHNSMVIQARQMFAENGVKNIPEEVVGVLVTDNADTTKAVVNKFSGWVKQWHDEDVKATLAGSEPRKGGASAMSKDEILAIKDRSQRLKAIEENFELFK